MTKSLEKNGLDKIRFLIILSFIIAGLFLKAYFITLIPINQDEFHYLSFVHSFNRGEPVSVYQTFHSYLFSWLWIVGNNEVDQVIAARTVMFMFLCGTCVCLFFLARHFHGKSAALFSVVCYISFTFVIINGASFRPDTIAVFLCMLALCLFMIRGDSSWANVLVGVLTALSCMFTIKTSIYLVLFILLALIRLHFSRYSLRSLKHTIYGGISFIVSFIAAYSIHASTHARMAEVTDRASYLGNAFSTFFTFREIFPGWKYFPAALQMNVFIWALLAFGFFLYVFNVIKKSHVLHREDVYLIVMFTPLLSLLVYRNSFPYYFAFITPPLTLFCGYTFHRFILIESQRDKRWTVIITFILTLVVFFNFVLSESYLFRTGRRIISHQRNVLIEIHRIFPEPVPYIDGCNMIASYPQVAFFMSTAGMKGYLNLKHPIFEDILFNKKPLLLLANVPHLDLTRKTPPASSAGLTMTNKDWIALRSHFIHHWGQVWVLGKQFNAGAKKLRENFDITVPGVYTLEANAVVAIDGRQFSPGDVIQLEQRTHTLEAKEATGIIKLRWGSHLYRPHTQPGSETLFMGIFG
ncbi:MAG: glycosyltransferase family 39 protein [Smithella sp.]|nr:glycosyltransferase family 39 protein [Smithella sp.]HQG66566.1 glycosyltransferase family 39 protein [Smithella sp.]HQH16584.1 glycosyltransferase family 39 protein [Smithella sp.]